MRGLWNLAVLLLALQLSGCSFNFNIEIMSYFISVGSSPCGEDLCAPYLSHFCLRGPRTNRSYLRTDCPLGTSGAIRGFPVFVNISSDQPWEGGFQLLIVSRDLREKYDPDLDIVFINSNDTAVGELSPTVTFFGRNGRLQVTARYQVICNTSYYGPSCSTFCQSADNVQDGHYYCNNTNGATICLTGFIDPETNCTAVDAIKCNQNPCQNGGICQDVTAGYTCTCADGYTGSNCSTSCASLDCPVHSTCKIIDEEIVCVCVDGYTEANYTEAQFSTGQALSSSSEDNVVSSQSARRDTLGLVVGGTVGALVAVGVAVCAFFAGVICGIYLQKKRVTIENPVSPASFAYWQLNLKENIASDNPVTTDYTYISNVENVEVPMTSNKAYVPHVQTSSSTSSSKQPSKPVDNSDNDKVSMTTNVCYGKKQHEFTNEIQNNRMENSEENVYLSINSRLHNN